MTKQNYTIAIIEDDPLVGATILEILDARYERVVHFSDPRKAIEDLDTVSPDLILIDIYLGHENGLEILERLRLEGITIPVIVMTAFNDIKIAVRAMKAGAEEFIVKPVDLDQLEVAVERALRNYDLRRQVSLLKEVLEAEKPSEIIGKSTAISSALNIAKIVAGASDTTALILGESGTGKELLARGVHALSGRTGRLVEVNCSAVPATMMESEFFGSVQGAYTGSTRDRTGLFEESDGGSVFLDEVGEMPVELQAKLLRFLETGEVRRIGANGGRRVDARLIAATNR
ncbi:MAG: sigma-54-dependent transcriptional regulator, partial [Candidatus Kapaibacterium sp.]